MLFVFGNYEISIGQYQGSENKAIRSKTNPEMEGGGNLSLSWKVHLVDQQ